MTRRLENCGMCNSRPVNGKCACDYVIDENEDRIVTDRRWFAVERANPYNPGRPKWFATIRTLDGAMLSSVQMPSRAKARKRVAEWAKNQRALEVRT